MDALFRPVTRSRNELYALAEKAARGAGLCTGLADDFAKAAVVHFCAGRDGQVLLAALKDGSAAALPSILDDLETRGTELVTGGHAPDVVESYCEARSKRIGRQITVSREGRQITLGLGGAALPSDAALNRPDVPAGIWDAFSTLAFKTYVPATEESRRTGAGAGLSDND